MATPFEQLPVDRFGDLVRQVRPRLKILLARYHIPLQDCEDLLQTTLLQLVYQWDRIRDHEAWLMGTMKRQCLMYWRDQRRRLYQAVDSALLELVSEPVAPEQERAELMRDLEVLIDRLPARCRALLTLRFQLGYEPAEVAAMLGYSAASIGKITSRCLAALNRELLATGSAGSPGGCSGCLAAGAPERPRRG
jgi:RNA polymerase sigma factor (sigma-70 family)